MSHISQLVSPECQYIAQETRPDENAPHATQKLWAILVDVLRHLELQDGLARVVVEEEMAEALLKHRQRNRDRVIRRVTHDRKNKDVSRQEPVAEDAGARFDQE